MHTHTHTHTLTHTLTHPHSPAGRTRARNATGNGKLIKKGAHVWTVAVATGRVVDDCRLAVPVKRALQCTRGENHKHGDATRTAKDGGDGVLGQHDFATRYTPTRTNEQHHQYRDACAPLRPCGLSTRAVAARPHTHTPLTDFVCVWRTRRRDRVCARLICSGRA